MEDEEAEGEGLMGGAWLVHGERGEIAVMSLGVAVAFALPAGGTSLERITISRGLGKHRCLGLSKRKSMIPRISHVVFDCCFGKRFIYGFGCTWGCGNAKYLLQQDDEKYRMFI